jgi:DNA-binding GntR family transcriptional regulator
MPRHLKPVRTAAQFQKAYDTLLERLQEGEGMYAPGEAIPAASTLGAQLGVSTATVGRVIKALIAEGWLVSGGNGYPARVRYRAPQEGPR